MSPESRGAEPPRAGAEPEAALPEAWRAHVRELRAENARRRKEAQELRAQLAALASEAEAARAAQAAAAEQAQRETARLAAAHRRLKDQALGRLARQALEEAAARRAPAGAGAACAAALGRAQRLLERVGAPVNPETELAVDDEGQVTLEPAAADRLRGLADELVDLVGAEPRGAGAPAPPVGGEPPRPARPANGPAPNAWDPALQRTPAARVRAARLEAAALDGLAQV